MDWYWRVGKECTGIGVWVKSGLVLACGLRVDWYWRVSNKWTGIGMWVISGLVLACG